MTLMTSFLNRTAFRDAATRGPLLAIGILLASTCPVDAATITAKSASRADVGTAVASAKDGDIVEIPAGSATWTTTLTITKNISLIGAGEGQTTITSNTDLTSPLISVDLDHEASAPNYSFRMSGFTLKSSNTTSKLADDPYINLYGHSNPADSPYVHGCVSRVRLDHMTWDKLNGLAVKVDSVLGVADHITADNGLRTSSMVKVHMDNWTPTNNPATGTPLPTTYKAADAFGSWADDSYFGTDKFWFYEDCNFTVASTFVADDEEGARVVYRHCTVNNGTGFASHGMEGRKQPGVRAREIYNNYFITTSSLAQNRSGSILYFNNRSSGIWNGVKLKDYRFQANYNMWGAASGDNRYDQNPASTTPIVTGTIAAVASPGDPLTATVTVGSSDSLSAIDLNDGSMYVIQDTDDPYDGSNNTANGWKNRQSGIFSIAGKVLTLTTGTTPDSAHWLVGHHYQIRKVLVAYGALGTGKGNLLNAGTAVSGYADTWTYPATSGTLAVAPQAGYPFDPCYAWNNTDDAHGYKGLSVEVYSTAGRDYFDLAERTIKAQNVGYPAVSYTRATSDYPKIGPGQTISYAPYVYPHPLVSGNPPPPPTPTPSPSATPEAPQNLQIVPGG